jgi:predicted secreted protein
MTSRLHSLQNLARPAALLFALLLTPAVWAGTLIDLSADATQAAPNDLARATAFAEASGATPQAVSSQVKSLLGEVESVAKSYDPVKRQSGITSTYPVYGKISKVPSWRMRSEVMLESRDIDALSELTGKLQEKLGVTNIQFVPAPETRKAAEDKAIQSAIAAFQDRAQLLARTLGKAYKIKKLNVNIAGNFQPQRLLGKTSSFGESESMPMEAGESQIHVTVSGQIELDD